MCNELVSDQSGTPGKASMLYVDESELVLEAARTVETGEGKGVAGSIISFAGLPLVSVVHVLIVIVTDSLIFLIIFVMDAEPVFLFPFPLIAESAKASASLISSASTYAHIRPCTMTGQEEW